MKAFLPLIISISISINGCGQQNPINKSNNIKYVIYGTYCGECSHNCAHIYKLVNNEVLLDPTDDFFNSDNFKKTQKSLAFNATALSKKQYLIAKKIEDSIPEILYKSEDKIFGHPDSHDQCGIFLQIQTKDKLKTFYIDTDSNALPKELKNYAVLIMTTCHEIK